MASLFKRKREAEPPLLYERFKADENLKKELCPKEVPNNTKTINKENSVITKNSKRLKIPYSIAICSLRKGCGCTHMTEGIAYYLNKSGKRVFVVTKQSEIFMETGISCGYEISGYDEYDHIIYDCGCMQDLEFSELAEIKKCQNKIMMCIDDTSYFKDLARFVDNELKFTKSWIYLFNYVPQERTKEVDDLMEDFTHACIPLFHSYDDKTVKKILERIW